MSKGIKNIINYEPMKLAYETEQLETEIAEYNERIIKRNKVMKKYYVLVAITAFLTDVFLFIEHTGGKISENYEPLFFLIFIAFLIIGFVGIYGAHGNFDDEERSFNDEATFAMKWHKAIHGKKVKAIEEWLTFWSYDVSTIRVHTENPDHSITETKFDFKPIRKTDIKEITLDIENGIVYFPYQQGAKYGN